jgi:hypothetical protein
VSGWIWHAIFEALTVILDTTQGIGFN